MLYKEEKQNKTKNIYMYIYSGYYCEKRIVVTYCICILKKINSR